MKCLWLQKTHTRYTNYRFCVPYVWSLPSLRGFTRNTHWRFSPLKNKRGACMHIIISLGRGSPSTRRSPLGPRLVLNQPYKQKKSLSAHKKTEPHIKNRGDSPKKCIAVKLPRRCQRLHLGVLSTRIGRKGNPRTISVIHSEKNGEKYLEIFDCHLGFLKCMFTDFRWTKLPNVFA